MATFLEMLKRLTGRDTTEPTPTQEKAPSAARPLAPPLRITLEPVPHPAWRAPHAIEAARDALAAVGFDPAGTYRVPGWGGAMMAGMVQPYAGVVATIVEHPASDGLQIDLVRLHGEAKSNADVLVVTNAGDDGLDRPPWTTVVRHPSEGAGGLWRILEAHVHEGAVVPVRPAEFRGVVEGTHAREMTWNVERDGPTEAELAAVSAAATTSVAALRAAWTARLTEARVDGAREQFVRDAGMTALDWERVASRALLVHDALDGGDLDRTILTLLDGVAQSSATALVERARQHRGEATGRDGFARMLDALPDDRRPEKLGTVETPIGLDVYAVPDPDTNASRLAA